ncbi:MAG TPA: BglII/BstYI family type II restriction endonuclease [Vicinamibacterales bacterium]|nr:BglII/BstYI family type II restriction endonuclease [Vicinamibacterales bacterium]
MDPSIPAFVRAHYAIEQWRHAIAIMKSDFSDEWQDVLAVLCGFRLQRSHISVGGGRKSQVADALDRAFADRGWGERSFATRIVVDDYSMDSPTHKVDCFKNGVGLEIEWNNKDPFFDRDLNNFRLLFELRALHVGIIVTRCDELQTIFEALELRGKYGASTTHWGKLVPRIEGGAGGGCPIIAFGIKKELYVED